MNQINDLLDVSLKSLKEMLEANMIIGNPITYNSVTIIPISKLHFTFLSGGSDIRGQNSKQDVLFGGGSGGGAIVNPICFLVITNKDVSVLSIDNKTHLLEVLMDYAPIVYDKCKNLFNDLKITEEK